MNELFNLSDVDDHERSTMNRRKIEFNKLLSEFRTKSRRDSKPSKCLYCLRDTTNFCNSHTVPASFLKNIAVDGKIFTTNKIMDLPLFDTEKGVSNSGTFHVICRDCDSKIFQEYENTNNYEREPTSKMIAQIAMKNHLRSISKRRYEIAFYNIFETKLSKDNHLGQYPNGYFDHMNEVNRLDLNEYMRGFKRAKKVIEKGWNNEYYLFYYEKLNYIVPIAFQGEVALNFGFNGYTINNVYNKDKKYKIQTLHVAIFPLDSVSIIMLFIDKNDKRYRAFYKQFKTLSKHDQLSAINYIIFSLSEDVYMSKEIHELCNIDDKFKKIAGLTSIQFLDSPADVDKEILKESFNFSHMNMIPNLLLMKHEGQKIA